MAHVRRYAIVAVGGIVAILLAGVGFNSNAIAQRLVATDPSSSDAMIADEGDPYVKFVLEAYDSIQNNFWKKGSDTDLSNLFQLSLAKVTGTTTPLGSNDRAGVAKILTAALEPLAPDKKKDLILNTLIVALYNLPPNGRNQLLSSKQETELRQDVSNIDPNKDLYADVGATSGASQEEVESAFVQKKTELEKSDTEESKKALAQAQYAYEVLTKPETKDRYDEAKIEPTIFSRVIGKTLYIYISKMAPTTFEEFVSAITSRDATQGLDSMIIDLRGNIGGSLDIAPYVVGLFVGPNQYVFDLYHQDDYEVIRSPQQKLSSLSRLRDVAILTDNMTQSTAELIAASLKRYHLAYVVGETTRGWGTVENTFKLETPIDPNETYALLLVHSLTLRDDSQPIEGAGVVPDITIGDPNWTAKLPEYFRSRSVINALTSDVRKAPLR